MKKFLIFLIMVVHLYAQTPSLDTTQNALSQLITLGLHKNQNPIRLHLGCGESKLDGYINVDLPPSQHTVLQTTFAADVFADITKLRFPDKSVHEIRSHHVFEHFERPIALALLCKWYTWLTIDGALVIETPDFLRSIKIILDNKYSYQQKQSTLRHIFGSHEARWAVHCDGWYPEKFKHVLEQLGFENITIKETEWKLCPNIIITAKKWKNISSLDLALKSKNILRDSMVDMANSEESLWKAWCLKFDEIFMN